MNQERCHRVAESPSGSCKAWHLPTTSTMAERPRSCKDRHRPPPGRLHVPHPSQSPRRPPFAPSRPQPGPRPVRCHLGIPHGPIPALPVDALAFGIVDIPWCRNATVGTVPPRKLGCGLNLAARGRIITRYLMGGLTDLTNQGAIKWVGRCEPKFLLSALNSC